MVGCELAWAGWENATLEENVRSTTLWGRGSKTFSSIIFSSVGFFQICLSLNFNHLNLKNLFYYFTTKCKKKYLFLIVEYINLPIISFWGSAWNCKEAKCCHGQTEYSINEKVQLKRWITGLFRTFYYRRPANIFTKQNRSLHRKYIILSNNK